MPLIAKNIILSATLMIGVGTTSLTLAQTSQPPVTPSVTTAQADVLETNDAIVKTTRKASWQGIRVALKG